EPASGLAGSSVQRRELCAPDRQPQILVSLLRHLLDVSREAAAQLRGFTGSPGPAQRQDQRGREHVGPVALEAPEFVAVAKAVVVDRQEQALVAGGDQLAREP